MSRLTIKSSSKAFGTVLIGQVGGRLCDDVLEIIDKARMRVVAYVNLE